LRANSGAKYWQSRDLIHDKKSQPCTVLSGVLGKMHWRVIETKPLKPARNGRFIHELGAPGRIDGKNGQEHQQSPCK